jgi:hypothetical protein
MTHSHRAVLCGTFAALILAWGAARAPSQQKAPFPPAPEEGKFDPVPAIATQPMPREELMKVYRAELGARFDAAHGDQLEAAQQLIEKYFAASSSSDRKGIVQSIEAAQDDPATLGRMAHIRLYWPALAPGVYYVNARRGSNTVQYFLGVPQGYDRTRAWPMVVKLATPNAFETNPPPDAARVAAMYDAWIKDDLAHHPGTLVLMPLLELEAFYGPSYAGMNRVIQPMLDAADRANVDPARVYLLGHSSAALAVWNLGLHDPTYFSAIVPLAGAAANEWERLRLMNLRNTLSIVWHDSADPVIKVGFARSLVNALRQQKEPVEYIETHGQGHNPTDAIIDQCYAKMLAHERPLYPQRVSLQSNRPDTLFNRVDWVQLWQEADPGKDRRIPFHNASGFMTLHEKSARIDATRNGNAIDLTVENVESLRLYLNDQMVDVSKPLTITINRRRKVEGWVKPSIDEMLKDQLLLGRGWRYYTAVLDIDLTPPATRPAATRPAPGAPLHKGRIIVGPGAAE